MMRLSRCLRQSVQNQTKIRDMHLNRKGMDRDNYLQGVTPGPGAYAFILMFGGLLWYKSYCTYCMNLEHRYLRLPVGERQKHGRVEPEMWLFKRETLNTRHEGFEFWRSTWKLMLQPHRIFFYPVRDMEVILSEYNFEGYAKDGKETRKVGGEF